MKKKSRVYIGISIIFIIILGLSYQYYRINLGVPRKFNVEKYSMGEAVKLDDFEITINNIDKGEDVGDVDSEISQTIYNLYKVDLTIKNISNEQKDIKPFYTKSLLLHDNDISEIPIELGNEDMMSSLLSQEEKEIQLTYNFISSDESRAFEFYLPRELYSDDIKKDLKDLKMCQKYIELYMKK